MKKFFFSLLFFFVCFLSYSQTTQEEYNYITKGYIDDVNKGKDIKTGYSLKLALENSKITQADKWWSVSIYYFKKGTVNKALMLDCTDHAGNRRFFCIPTNNASDDLWNKMFKDFQSAGSTWHELYVWALSKLVSKKLL